MLIVHPNLVAQNTLTYQHLFKVDSSFNYASYGYLFDFKDGKDISNNERELNRIKRASLFKPYYQDTTVITDKPILWDGKWGIYPCNCYLNIVDSTFKIIQEFNDYSGTSRQTIQLDKKLSTSALMQFLHQDIPPKNIDIPAKKTIIIMNQNPIYDYIVLRSGRVVMDRIVEGYVLTQYAANRINRPILFRCLVEIEGGKEDFKRRNIKKE